MITVVLCIFLVFCIYMLCISILLIIILFNFYVIYVVFMLYLCYTCYVGFMLHFICASCGRGGIKLNGVFLVRCPPFSAFTRAYRFRSQHSLYRSVRYDIYFCNKIPICSSSSQKCRGPVEIIFLFFSKCALYTCNIQSL
jgi:hypothetical protein